MRAVNLIPSDERGSGVAGGRSEGAAYLVLALIACLAVLALLYGLARHQVSSRRSQLATVTARTQRAQETSSSLSRYTNFIALREQRVQAVDQLVDSRFDWAHALHELGRVLPSDASITSLDGTVGSLTGASKGVGSAAASSSVTSATPPGSVPTFTLGGCATSQAEVALTLQRLRLIDGVENVTLQSSAKGTGGGSTGSASSSSAGQCGQTTFTVLITFDALPTVPSSGTSATELTSASGGER